MKECEAHDPVAERRKRTVFKARVWEISDDDVTEKAVDVSADCLLEFIKLINYQNHRILLVGTYRTIID